MSRPKVRLSRWSRLRVLVVNGHVGIPLRNGALAWLLRRFRRVDVIFVQEGRDAHQWKSDARGYQFVPEPRKADQPMTYVLVRSARFEVLEETREDIRHGGQYPRELNGVTVRDRKSGRILSLSSLHPDPLGRGFERASHGARESHVDQVGEYVAFHAEQDPDVIPVSAGDSNEWLPTTTGKGSARYQFADIGMTPLFKHLRRPGPVDLMEVFARFGTDVKAVSRRVVHIPTKGMDHPAIYAVLKIRHP